jgi:hypothetical protein
MVTAAATPPLSSDPVTELVSSQGSQELSLSKVKDFAQLVFKEKNENRSYYFETKLGTCKRYDPIILGGDLFTFGYLGLKTLGKLSHSIGSTSGFIYTSLAFGVASGVIMVLIGGNDCLAGIHKLKNNEIGTRGWWYGILLLLTGLSEIALGCCLVADGIAPLLHTSFFAPWVIPFLFLVPSLCTLGELGKKLKLWADGEDIPSLMKLDELQTKFHAFVQDEDFSKSEKSEPEGGEKLLDLSACQPQKKEEVVKSFAAFLSAILGIELISRS